MWVWLVAGLLPADLEPYTQQVAVACWARDCRVGRPKRLAGLVWVDVIRRDPLTASRPYPSTLLGTDTTEPVVPAASSAQLEDRDDAPVAAQGAAEASVIVLPPAAGVAREDGPLDVPRTVIDLDALRTDSPATNGTGTGTGRSGRNGKPAAKRTNTDTGTEGASAPVAPIVGRGGEDIGDWL